MALIQTEPECVGTDWVWREIRFEVVALGVTGVREFESWGSVVFLRKRMMGNSLGLGKNVVQGRLMQPASHVDTPAHTKVK